MVFTSEFFDCHEFCENSEHLNDGKVIFQSDTYNYSHYYHYSQLIRRNQNFPNISGNFEKFVTTSKIDVKFPFTFYGAHLDTFSVDKFGKIYLTSQDGTGVIYNNFKCNFGIKTETLVGEDYFAVRRSCPTNIDNKIDTIKIMHLIRSNGKISFYYENIPTGLKKDTFASGIGYFTHCGEALKGPEIRVPGEWIQTGTLVEYEVLGSMSNHILSEFTIFTLECITFVS
ncbi:unnamed protein product [Schistosoma haematobium]|nr:unnamed protein product [Schistosoma haematobium]